MMRKNTMQVRPVLRIVSFKLALLMLFQTALPTVTWALTGGPSQPEVQSFEPIGTSEMVDIFSGDFTYNIPLLDIEGYPINIAYQSGISTDQEASWVGLGWNINPGVVNRTMRGIPDDFSGDQIVKEFHVKNNVTTGISASGQVSEIFGKKLKFGSLSLSMGIRFNNYTGWSRNLSVTPGINSGESSAFRLNAGLGISMSSDEGSSVQPNVGVSLMSEKTKNSQNTKSSLGLSFGGSFSSRGGVGALSVNGTASAQMAGTRLVKNEKNEDVPEDISASTSVGIVGTSFDFGQPTFSPHSEMNFRNFGITGTFSLGLEASGAFGGLTFSGYRSRQKLAETVRTNNAYGYLNSHRTNSTNALHDFNRENDGGFNESTPALSMATFTNDLFNVVGQGVGGSYRPFRSDIGTAYDPFHKSEPNDNISLELELGAGGFAKVGGTIGFARATSGGGRWLHGNPAAHQLKFRSTGNSALYEPVYFKEANEKSVDPNAALFNKVGGGRAVRVKLHEKSKYNVVTKLEYETNSDTISINGNIQKQNRDNRNQYFSYLTHSEVMNGLGVQPLSPLNDNLPGGVPGHHISEITVTSTDGARYVYGLPAYNTNQEEVSFAIGASMNSNNPVSGQDFSTGLFNYDPSDAGPENDHGLDNYFSKTTIPKYAHSYLLTCILSSDYIDADQIQGPSDNDFGNYTLFHYGEVENYKWRTPEKLNRASFSEGLKSDIHDDKASFTNGSKNLYYLRKIETRNYVCEFILEDREDGRGVNGRHGGVNEGARMKRLKEIRLYTRHEFNKNEDNDPGTNGIPVKVVHFKYDYSLCPGVGNNLNGGGKLTLKEIYFTYQNSEKARYSSYKFDYTDPVTASTLGGTLNPSYNLKGYDRWGTYKRNLGQPTWNPFDLEMSNSENPYTPQDNTADLYAQAWHLQRIQLPSGGAIEVDYESDDYAYVQNRRACRMFSIIGSSSLSENTPDNSSDTPNYQPISGDHDPNLANKKLYFKFDSGFTNVSEYVKKGDEIFYKFLVDFRKANNNGDHICEYVPGYAIVKDTGGDGQFGWITLEPVRLTDNGETKYSPITKTAIQFARLNLPDQVYGVGGSPGDDSQLKQALLSIIDAIASLGELFTNPNKKLYNDGIARDFITQRSMVRLRDPDGIKKGGGVRVREIKIYDQWDPINGVSETPGTGASYGQRYTYRLLDGRSSGVASYEPQIGGEENPFKKPIYYDTQKKGVPDDRFFMEEPLGESFFPSASVGYSRVVVENIVPSNVTRHATGQVVHEFYTAKDYPTIVSRTSVSPKRHKSSPFSIRSLTKINVKDYMTATQGFSVQTNDMHGKPKAQYVFAENSNSPISSVSYIYQDQDYGGNGGEPAKRLVNTCKTISPEGEVQNNSLLGVMYDVMNDARESYTKNTSFEAKGNTDVLPFFGITTFMIWPEKNFEQTQFRSMTTTKVVQSFGILKETIAVQDGSTVSTKTLAYDSKTGEPLLTETINNFNDFVYTLNYPAYWHYREMGPACQNGGLQMTLDFDASGKAIVADGAKKYFAEGDEISLNGTSKAWIVEVANTYIKAVDRAGNPVNAAIPGPGSSGVPAGTYKIKVLRSGFRNMQMGQMANITTKKDPLESIQNNLYERVLQASAIEYRNTWPTDCPCFDGTNLTETTNPYILGTKGYWKPSTSYLHLTGRTQSDYNENTNIRQDGVFESYNPFYKRLLDGSWVKDYTNWTYTSEVTLFSPYGPELENRDALERYSSATFGYHQTLPTSVAANASYQEVGFESFEDYGANNSSQCNDRKFKLNDFDLPNPIGELSDTKSHTGRYSMKVDGPLKKKYEIPEPCDDPDCSMNIQVNSSTVNFTATVTISGGQAPYAISWDTSNGYPVVSMSQNSQGTVLNITSTAPWSMTLYVTDAAGSAQQLNVYP
jgi:hypothetical protein